MPGLYAILTKWGQSDATDSYGIWLHNPDGHARLLGGINTPGIGSLGGLRNGGTVPPDKWSHVAMTYDGVTGLHRLYVDGVQAAERVQIGGMAISDLTVLIGKEDSYLPRFFKGAIDEVAIFDRALDPSEIEPIFSAGSAGKCPTSVGGIVDLRRDPSALSAHGSGSPTVPYAAVAAAAGTIALAAGAWYARRRWLR